MAKTFKNFPVILLALLCIISLCHSQGTDKTCDVTFSSSGTCSGTFGVMSCYNEATAKYGPRPPTKCQCIPNGSADRSCKCTIHCSAPN